MANICLLKGNSTIQKKQIHSWKKYLESKDHFVSICNFQDENAINNLTALVSQKYDWIIAYNLDILSLTLTGGDYFINKLSNPVLLILDQCIADQISLFHKRLNITILIYSIVFSDISLIQSLEQPVFCSFIPDSNEIDDIIKSAESDIFKDY